MTWSTEQILTLAPDASSAKSGRDLAAPRKWVSLGRSEAEPSGRPPGPLPPALWGECQGSGKLPYQTTVDLSEPAFRCTCPSRKFPCKHALGLFLIFAAQPDALAQGEPPAWVTEWLASRAGRAERRATRVERSAAGETADPAARAKRSEQRETRVAAGLEELDRWLRDRVRHGLAALTSEPEATWEGMASRMVDAQAPGIARLVREMAAIPGVGDGWQGRLLARFAVLHLLIEGFRHREALPPETDAELRAAIGWTQAQEELQVAEGVRDRWRVVGQRVEQEARLRVQRTWLWGETSDRPALLLHFAHASQPLDGRFLPGMTVEGEAVYFPGAYPLRAVMKEPFGTSPDLGCAPRSGYATIAAALSAYAAALAGAPWLERFPMLLAEILPVRRGEAWQARDTAGDLLPLSPRCRAGWHLLILAGGRPIALFGEWDGETLYPLSVISREGITAIAKRGLPLSTSLHPAVIELENDPHPIRTPHATLHNDAAWSDLVTVAMLGTAREGVRLPEVGGALGELCGRLAGDDAEGTLLGAAAALSLFRRAGWRPAVDREPLPEPCPADETPTCSARAGARLARMLNGEWPQMLDEWLVACAAAGKRVPTFSLPDLLHRGRQEPALQAAIAPLLGPPGRWLAGQNPAWEWAIEQPIEDPKSLWEIGEERQRLALLVRLRREDPGRARELVASTWSAETAATRGRQLAAFREGLSLADEPFLEAALDDPAAPVRQAAAELLSRLPESALCRRMEARMRILLSLVAGAKGREAGPPARLGAVATATGKVRRDLDSARVRAVQRRPRIETLAVTLPGACDAGMLRDGVTPKQKWKGLGVKVGWLAQMLAAVPPADWERAWSRSPAELVAGAGRGEWKLAFLIGWTIAAGRHRDAAWAEALMPAWLAFEEDPANAPFWQGGISGLELIGRHARVHLWREMLLELPSEPRDALLLRLAEQEAILWPVLKEHDWSPALTRRVMARLRSLLASSRDAGRIGYDRDLFLHEAAARAHPSVLAEVAADWPPEAADWPGTDQSIARFLERIRFRHEMLQEICE